MVQTLENGILVLLGSLFFPLLPLLGMVGNVFTFYTRILMAKLLYHPPKTRTSALRTSLITYLLMAGTLLILTCLNSLQNSEACCSRAWLARQYLAFEST